MKIVVTGSLGNIGKPLTQELIQQGHSVTVISSNPKKQKAIEALGAHAAIGKLEDVSFLSTTFRGAEAVYCMIPLNPNEAHFMTYMKKIAHNYVEALKQTGIKRVVVLSGWSANLLKGDNVEDVFINQLPGTSITIMRPGSFYTNFYASMDMIRGKGLMGMFMTLRYVGLKAFLKGERGLLMGNYGGDDRIVFVSPKDIAEAAAEELVSRASEQIKIRYIGSEEMACSKAAKIIGAAIGKPYLRWIRISDKAMIKGLKMAKIPTELAENMVEMQAMMHSGLPLKNFHKNNPKMGRVKLADFAKEFSKVYLKKG